MSNNRIEWREADGRATVYVERLRPFGAFGGSRLEPAKAADLALALDAIPATDRAAVLGAFWGDLKRVVDERDDARRQLRDERNGAAGLRDALATMKKERDDARAQCAQVAYEAEQNRDMYRGAFERAERERDKAVALQGVAVNRLAVLERERDEARAQVRTLVHAAVRERFAAATGRTIEAPRFEVTINGEPLRWTDIPVTARGVALDDVEAGDVATSVKVPRYPLRPGSRFDGAAIVDLAGDRLTLERRDRGVLVVCESPQGGSSWPWLADVLSLAEREGLL